MSASESKNETKKSDLEAELIKAKNAAEEYLAGWKRAKADYANLKKETARERENFLKFANQVLIAELLPIMDNFNSAWNNLKIDERGLPWAEGIGHIKRQLEEVLKMNGVCEINEIDKPFDPLSHETVGKEKVEGKTAGTVLRIVRSGYKLHEKILRPAQVIITE